MNRFSSRLRGDLVELRLQGPEVLFGAWKVSPPPGTDLWFRLRDAGGILVSEGPAHPEGKHYFRVPPVGAYALALGHKDGGEDFRPIGVSGWVSAMPLHVDKGLPSSAALLEAGYPA